MNQSEPDEPTPPSSSSSSGSGSTRVDEFVAARRAAELLGVKLATLYAYTSRGLVQSVSGETGRKRLYRRSDLERLRARRDARAGHGPVAAAALRFGEPVLDSSITSISAERGPSYRGREALALAEDRVSFESVAEILWHAGPAGGVADRPSTAWRIDDLGVPLASACELSPPETSPLATLATLVPWLASRDPGRFTDQRESVISRSRHLIRRMAAGLGLSREPAQRASSVMAALRAPSVASAIAEALGAQPTTEHATRGVEALDRALVLGADHELNASTFAARVAASTGADVYAGVSAALACLSGPRHGGASDRVEALLLEIGEPENAERVVHARQRRGETIDGFRHPLYRDGDPRGAALIELARELAPESIRVRTLLALVDAMERASAGRPNIDAGLVALSLALELPAGAAVGIFAIARSAGWVAHMLEQYEAGYLVRPRARYRPDAEPTVPAVWPALARD